MKYNMKYRRAVAPLLMLIAMFVTPQFTHAQSATRDTLSLGEAVRMAVQAAPALHAAEAAVDAAKARVREIDSYAYPQLSGNAGYTRIDPVISITIPGPGGSSNSFSTMPNDNYTAGLNFSQLITGFGREGANERVAESGIKSAEDNLDAAKMMAAYQTVQVYYAMLTSDESLHVVQDQLKIVQENLGITQERQKQGTVTSLDPLSVRVRISALENQIADISATRKKQEAMLHRLTGIAPGVHIPVVKPARDLQVPGDMDTLIAIAERQRPEIALAKDAERTARLQVEAAKMTNYPVLSANVAGGVKDGYLPNLTDPKLNWSGNISLHVPILDGGLASSQVEQAEANLRVAETRTLDARRSIASDIEQAEADLQSSSTRLLSTQVQIDQAQQAYDVANVRYKNGAATSLDVLTAQSALEDAYLQSAQIHYAFELSLYNVNRAIGTPMW